jgi:hypothetical protein
MQLSRGPGLSIFAVLVALGAAWVVSSRLGYLDRLQARLFPKTVAPVRLSPGDFPAGVSAPVGDIATVPLRPTLIGFTPRGSSSALLLAAGGATSPDSPAPADRAPGLFRTAYALDAQAVVHRREGDLRAALAAGAENGGVDMAFVTVDRLPRWLPDLRDAAPRTVMLVGRSRGQEALAAVGADTVQELKGKKLGVYEDSGAWYFALWALSRAGLSLRDVDWVELPSSLAPLAQRAAGVE